MKTHLGLIISLLLALSSVAWPDSAPVFYSGIDGGDVLPIKNQQIQMVREVVNIDCAWTTYTVQADFWFKNTTGAGDKNYNSAFPLTTPIMAMIGMMPGKVSLRKGLQTFKVEWRGKPVEFTLGKLQKRDSSKTNFFASGSFGPPGLQPRRKSIIGLVIHSPPRIGNQKDI